jgi:hypothetical protein
MIEKISAYCMNLHLTYFGDETFSLGKERIKRQAENFNIFKSIQEFGENDLNVNHSDFWNECKKYMMQQRIGGGKKYYGYYACKPYFILEALKNIPENDVLLYVDSGCELNKNGILKIYEYYNECINSNGVFFSLNYPEIQWTKMDTYRRIMLNDDYHLNTRQIISGIFFIKNTKEIKSIIKEWLNICLEDKGHFLNDNPSKLPNDKIFVENRHDQSILSLLIKKYSNTCDFEFHEDETYEVIWDAAGRSNVPVGQEQAKIWNTYGREYPIWATRNGRIDFTYCEV